MLREVRLYGKAAKLFGRSFKLDVQSIAEAIRALGSQLPGFRDFIREHSFQIFVGPKMSDEYGIVLDQVSMLLPEQATIHVKPVITGAKQQNPAVKIIAGVGIAAVAWWLAPVAGLGAAILPGVPLIGGITYGSVVTMGLGLAFTGISQMLAKTNDTSDSSYAIGDDLTTGQQGVPVPLIYGSKVRVVQPIPISVGVITADLGSSNGILGIFG